MLLIKSLLQYNYIYICAFFMACVLVYYITKIFNFQNFFKHKTSLKIIRVLLILSLLISFFIHIFIFWLYVEQAYVFLNLSLNSELVVFPKFINTITFNSINIFNCKVLNLYLTLDFFGLILLTLSYIVGFISILALDTRLYWKNIKYIFAFNIFVVIVYLYVSVSNIIIFFLLYECLLVPSFLFVYFVSPSRRAIQASLYFVI